MCSLLKRTYLNEPKENNPWPDEAAPEARQMVRQTSSRSLQKGQRSSDEWDGALCREGNGPWLAINVRETCKIVKIVSCLHKRADCCAETLKRVEGLHNTMLP
jgi:hypothetical protein